MLLNLSFQRFGEVVRPLIPLWKGYTSTGNGRRRTQTVSDTIGGVPDKGR